MSRNSYFNSQLKMKYIVILIFKYIAPFFLPIFIIFDRLTSFIT